MKRTDHSDPEFDETVERELRSLLSADPSPGFQARVSERIAREQQPRRGSFTWIFAAGFTAVIAAVFVFLQRGDRAPQPPTRTEMVEKASPHSTAPLINASVPSQSPRPQRKTSKAAKPEPQLIIASNEASALRRLLSGAVYALPEFEPQVRKFQTRETAVEPLVPPAAITIEPLALPQPEDQDIRR